MPRLAKLSPCSTVLPHADSRQLSILQFPNLVLSMGSFIGFRGKPVFGPRTVPCSALENVPKHWQSFLILGHCRESLPSDVLLPRSASQAECHLSWNCQIADTGFWLSLAYSWGSTPWKGWGALCEGVEVKGRRKDDFYPLLPEWNASD